MPVRVYMRQASLGARLSVEGRGEVIHQHSHLGVIRIELQRPCRLPHQSGEDRVSWAELRYLISTNPKQIAEEMTAERKKWKGLLTEVSKVVMEALGRGRQAFEHITGGRGR